MPDAPRDHRFHPRRQLVPVQRPSFDPSPVAVAAYLSAQLHPAQQLDGKERVAGGAPVEHGAEFAAQLVGFTVDQRGHEGGPFALHQIDLNVAHGGLQFANHVQQGVGLTLPAETGLFRAIGTYEQDLATRYSPRQVKEQVNRARVDPLHVVEDQQQGPALSQGAEGLRQLIKQSRLLHAQLGRSLLQLLQQPFETFQPVQSDPAMRVGQGQQRPAGQEAVDQIRALLDQGVDHSGQPLPQPPAGFGADHPGGDGRLHFARQHPGDGQKRKVGVALTGKGAALAPGDQQLRVSGQRAAGELDQQRRFAVARLAGHETDAPPAAGCPRQRIAQRFQLLVAGHEQGGLGHSGLLGGEVGGQPTGWAVLPAGRFGKLGDGEGEGGTAVPDLLNQADGLRLGVNPQLLGEGLAACFVLGQGGAALAAQCQEPHQVAMGRFFPRFEFNPAPGEIRGGRHIAQLGVRQRQAADGLQQLEPEVLARCYQPLFERRAGKRQAFQKITPVERHGLLQPGDSGLIGQ